MTYYNTTKDKENEIINDYNVNFGVAIGALIEMLTYNVFILLCINVNLSLYLFIKLSTMNFFQNINIVIKLLYNL